MHFGELNVKQITDDANNPLSRLTLRVQQCATITLIAYIHMGWLSVLVGRISFLRFNNGTNRATMLLLTQFIAFSFHHDLAKNTNQLKSGCSTCVKLFIFKM